MDDKLQAMKKIIDKAKTDKAVVESQTDSIIEEIKKEFEVSSVKATEIQKETETEIEKRKKTFSKLQSEYDLELSRTVDEFPWED